MAQPDTLFEAQAIYLNGRLDENAATMADLEKEEARRTLTARKIVRTREFKILSERRDLVSQLETKGAAAGLSKSRPTICLSDSIKMHAPKKTPIWPWLWAGSLFVMVVYYTAHWGFPWM